MKTGLKRGLVLGLTACMAASSLAGCGKKEFDPAATVATLDGTEVSVGVANFLLRYQQAQFETYYGSYLQSYYGTDIWNADLYGNGSVYGDTFKQENITLLEKMLLTEKHMADYGVEISEEEASAITAAAEDFISSNEEEVLTKMSATQENVERVLTLYTIQYKMEQEMCADVDTEVSDEEAAQRTVSYVRFDVKSEEENEAVTEAAETEAAAEETEAGSEATVTEADSTKTESADEEETEDEETKAAKAEAKERAEAFLAVAKEAEDFAAAAEEVTANDPDSATSYFTFGGDDTYPDIAIIDATRDLEDDTVVDEVIEANDSYYVLHVDDAFDEDAVASKKAQIIEERKQDMIDALYDEWMDAAEFKVKEKVYDQLIYDIALTIETEAVTEAATEAVTEEVTEEVTEAATEVESETVTEEITEAAETETEK